MELTNNDTPLCRVCNHHHRQGVKCETCGHTGKSKKWADAYENRVTDCSCHSFRQPEIPTDDPFVGIFQNLVQKDSHKVETYKNLIDDITKEIEDIYTKFNDEIEIDPSNIMTLLEKFYDYTESIRNYIENYILYIQMSNSRLQGSYILPNMQLEWRLRRAKINDIFNSR